MMTVIMPWKPIYLKLDANWFQPNGITFLTSHQSMDLWKDHSTGQINSRFDTKIMWFYIVRLLPVNIKKKKYKIYADNLALSHILEQMIRLATRKLQIEMLEWAIENWSQRKDHLKCRLGQHLIDVIFIIFFFFFPLKKSEPRNGSPKTWILIIKLIASKEDSGCICVWKISWYLRLTQDVAEAKTFEKLDLQKINAK